MGFNDEMDFDLDEIRKLLKEKDEKPEGSSDGEDGAAEAAAVERPRRQEKRAPRRVGKRKVTSESSRPQRPLRQSGGRSKRKRFWKTSATRRKSRSRRGMSFLLSCATL